MDQPQAGPLPVELETQDFKLWKFGGIFAMSSQSKSHPGRILAMLPAMVAVLCSFATLAAAEDQPAPKWELYGGYSFFHFAADIHGQLPGALLPLSSRLEVNPRGIGASGTYNFNRWLGLTLDYSTHFGSGETTLGRTIDDAGLPSAAGILLHFLRR
jgi:hypothetical protein